MYVCNVHGGRRGGVVVSTYYVAAYHSGIIFFTHLFTEAHSHTHTFTCGDWIDGGGGRGKDEENIKCREENSSYLYENGDARFIVILVRGGGMGSAGVLHIYRELESKHKKEEINENLVIASRTLSKLTQFEIHSKIEFHWH